MIHCETANPSNDRYNYIDRLQGPYRIPSEFDSIFFCKIQFVSTVAVQNLNQIYRENQFPDS